METATRGLTCSKNFGMLKTPQTGWRIRLISQVERHKESLDKFRTSFFKNSRRKLYLFINVKI
ncbi:hypothetical protein PanWU01x14_306180 [Parasponia andersonii]|uniref:Uncharacterized protein n=1 Tax=Parasponia andersonii TaxID=3476 RepID=A0A2P5ARY1_PARAD|nr:hypothetical protein PanWU01x14_306180 [Parasponia andersonii]